MRRSRQDVIEQPDVREPQDRRELQNRRAPQPSVRTRRFWNLLAVAIEAVPRTDPDDPDDPYKSSDDERAGDEPGLEEALFPTHDHLRPRW